MNIIYCKNEVKYVILSVDEFFNDVFTLKFRVYEYFLLEYSVVIGSVHPYQSVFKNYAYYDDDQANGAFF